MAHQHGIEPSDSTRTAGRAAEFIAFFTHHITQAAADFARKWTTADPRGVGFANAEHPVQAARGDAGAAENRADPAIRRGHERIGPMIDVEHYTMGAFK